MDLYDEKEEIISSDEYSEEEDDDDALMNDAIRAQGSRINSECQKPKWQIDLKQKQLSSLIRRNKISVIYKNKSIKWLNNKKQRERYKLHFARNYVGGKKRQKTWDISPDVKKIEADNIINLDNEDDEGVGNMEDNNPIKGGQPKYEDSMVVDDEPGNTSGVAELSKQIFKTKDVTTQSNKAEFSKKRARSSSPIDNENPEVYLRAKTDGSQFYKQINETFPAFDEIAKSHIEFLTTNNVTSIENKMKHISQEIKTLNDILHRKEVEWNRILHLKIVKQELYSRLSRKKYTVEMNETLTKSRTQNSLLELKELEAYLSEKPAPNTANSSIQQIIENRANMKTEDLEREKNSTSRLHSLLVSSNMLPDIETSDMMAYVNGDIKVKGNIEPYQHLWNRNIRNRGRQGEFKDVKSIIADFRQKCSNMLPEDVQFAKENKSEIFHTNKSVDDDALFTTSGNLRKHPKAPQFVPSQTLHNQYNSYFDERTNFKEHDKRNNVSSPKGIQYPYCQECKIHESRFVCAGCGNQWYCSKKCQISAWDKHSEICTD